MESSQSPSNDSYVLLGGEPATKRLKLLARAKWPTTKTLLRRVSVRKGMRCLDVGCGNGAVTLRLALRVGSTGQAVGIDRDERCLEFARRKAAQYKLPAVFRAENITDLREVQAYDLVYARFLLTHLAQPAESLQRMVRAVQPGGLVIVEDIEFAAHFCHPPCPAFSQYVDLYQEAVKRKGGDPNIGPRLVSLFLDSGLDDVQLEVVQPTFRNGPGKRIASITMAHIQEAVVQQGLASATEVEDIVANLDQFTADCRTILSFPRIFQVWGRKA
ncbi:MAG TPA: class I SAM-dependent methyltransferase [Gemmataceae bacterium]|nr:class I SAM-dependent methyltransferase [Gemmataceae bacterium]